MSLEPGLDLSAVVLLLRRFFSLSPMLGLHNYHSALKLIIRSGTSSAMHSDARAEVHRGKSKGLKTERCPQLTEAV